MESSSSSAAASTSTSTSVMMAMKAEVGGSCAVGGESSEAAAAAAAAAAICGVNEDQVLMCRGIQLKKAKKERGCTAKERISKMPPSTAGKRSSIYRGVTRHRWTGRYEAHLWDKSTWNQNQNKKGKQVYLGAYDEEEAAARAYDLAALKYWGPGTLINFPVTDYTRDLDEMQNVSREEYLASLRRKSSGFSRGLAKYRGLSSRWDLSFGRMAGTDYFNSVHCGAGDHPTANNEYIGGLSIERKIDLTGYIKWWGHNKSRQAESSLKSSDETKRGCIEDVTRELKTLEGNVHASEPYQMPCLGTSVEKHERTPKMSAMSILSRSAAYRSLQEKEAEKHENNENENKNAIARVDHGKAIEKSTSHDNSCSEKVGLAHGMAEASSLQRNMYPLTPFLSAPLLTSYSSIDPLVDPILWASLAPGLHPGLSRNSEVTKTETSSTYTFFRPDE